MTKNIPVISSIISPHALAHEILPGFGIGEVTECQYYTGGFNHTYRVRTVDGGTYYLRAYRKEWRTLADIQYELDVLNHLKSKGFPAARVLPYQDGKLYFAAPAPEGTRYLVLFSEAPGSLIAYTQEITATAHRYGQSMAQMHNALDDFNSPHARFHLDLDFFTALPLLTIEPFLADRPQDWGFVKKFAEILRQRILALPAGALEQGFCHGDLQGYHANVAPDGTLTFFDFDCGGQGYRAYDLGVFLWCCRLENAPERWEPFLQGYREMRRINDLDVRAVPLFACARYLWHMGVHTRNSPDWGVEFLNDAYFADHLKRLRDAYADYLA